jgi:hypothetical protein
MHEEAAHASSLCTVQRQLWHLNIVSKGCMARMGLPPACRRPPLQTDRGFREPGRAARSWGWLW